MVVYACGTNVILKNSDLKGIICGIVIRSPLVLYEVGYFSNSEYRVVTLAEYEFSLEGVNTQRIGFI